MFSHRHYLSCGTQESPQFSGKLSLQSYVGKEETSIGCPKRSPGLDEWEVRTGRAWTRVPLPCMSMSTATARCDKTQIFKTQSSKSSFCLLSRELASSSKLLLAFPSPFPSSVKARLQLLYAPFSMSQCPS